MKHFCNFLKKLNYYPCVASEIVCSLVYLRQFKIRNEIDKNFKISKNFKIKFGGRENVLVAEEPKSLIFSFFFRNFGDFPFSEGPGHRKTYFWSGGLENECGGLETQILDFHGLKENLGFGTF